MGQSGITLLKFGGEIVEDRVSLANLAFSLKRMWEQEQKIVLVHGGGPYASKLIERLGMTPKMVGGRRVTDSETLEVMKMALPGVINSDVLSMLSSHQLPVVPASGIGVIRCHKRPPKIVSGSKGEKIDFGYVGDVDGANIKVIQHLLQGNFIPVMSPLSATDDGQILNINADTIATQIGRELQIDKMVLITKIGGVFENIDDKDSRFKSLTVCDAQTKIKSGIIKGGMIPKIEEGINLIEKSILTSFHVVGLETPNMLEEEMTSPGTHGTAVIKS